MNHAQQLMNATFAALGEEHPEFICPSCMWQGDMMFDGECPRCHGVLMDRKEYDKAEAINSHDDDLEDERLGL